MAKILVVEDEAITAMDIKNRLENLGFEVVGTASRGKEAIKKAGEFKPDLILMDIILKGNMDGIEAVEKINTICDVPVVYLTAHSDEKTLKRAKLTEPYGFVTKPVNQDGLGGAIETAIYKHDLDKKLKKSEEEIKQKNKVLDGINAIFRATITNRDEYEFGKTCLAVCEELTGSEFSFIGEINEIDRFDSIAVSERGWKACKMVKNQGNKSVNDNIIRGIRSRAIEEKKILIFNDPTNSPYWSGLPDDHYQINSFLGAPLIYLDEVIGLVALANKEKGYSQKDIELMELITNAITESLMHYRALKKLKENQAR